MSHRVLIADGNKFYAQPIIDKLVGEGFDVSWAQTNHEVLEKFRESEDDNKPFDVIVFGDGGFGHRPDVDGEFMALRGRFRGLMIAASTISRIRTYQVRAGCKVEVINPNDIAATITEQFAARTLV